MAESGNTEREPSRLPKIAWFLAKAAGAGIVSYATPRLLVSAGLPLDEWIVALGGSLHLTSETALWAATVVVGLLLFLADRFWRQHYRNVHHKELQAQTAPAASLQTEVIRATPAHSQYELTDEALDGLQRVSDGLKAAEVTWSEQDEVNLQMRRLEEDRRGYSDEWRWQAAKEEGRTKIQRDKPLGEALAYHVEGRWGVEFFDSLKAGRNPGGPPLERATQLGYDGTLTIWGKRSEAGVYEIIPETYWADHHIDLFSLMRRKARTVASSRAASDTLYFDLMVSRTQFERVMPCDVDAVWVRLRDNDNPPAKAGAEPSLYDLWENLDPIQLYQAACLWVGLSPPIDEKAQFPPQAIPMLHRLKKGIADGDLPYFNDPDGMKARLTDLQKALHQFSTTPLKIANDVEVSRDGLRAFAESVGDRPAFLFQEAKK